MTKKYEIQQTTCHTKQAEIVRDTMHLLSAKAGNFVDIKSNEEICYFIEDENTQRIAVIVGYLLYGSLLIDMLWVQKEHQRKGIGSKLISTLESYAVLQGATFAIVNTMEWWEAVPFYQSLGYEIEFVRHGYTNNAKQYSLRKNLF